jgi:hypothetical protein
MSKTSSSVCLSDASAGAMFVKSLDRPESIRTAGHRAHFGINLIRHARLPVRLLSPNCKNRLAVSSVIVDAIQISSSLSTDCHKDDYPHSHSDETTSVLTDDTTPVEKKVHFALLQTEELEPNPLYLLDDETCASLWYSEHERSSMKFRRDQALYFTSDSKDWRDGMNAIIHFCSQAIPLSSYDVEDVKEKAKLVLPRYRGLEVHGLPELSTLRRKHVKRVLMHMARIPKKMPQELRDRMVAARSMEYSRPCTILARILAEADAVEAVRSR